MTSTKKNSRPLNKGILLAILSARLRRPKLSFNGDQINLFMPKKSNEKYSVLSTLENNSSSEQFFLECLCWTKQFPSTRTIPKKQRIEFIKKSMHEGYLFTIVSDDNLISIPKFNSFNNTQNGVAENKNILITKQDEFAIELEERKPYEIRLENLIGENKIAEAISLFDEALDLDYNFEVKIWQEYLNWTLWQKQPQLFWKSITKAIQKNTVPELQDFGFEQLLNIDNSDAESRAFWFEKSSKFRLDVFHQIFRCLY